MVFFERGKDMEPIEEVTAVKENEECSFTMDHSAMFSAVQVKLAAVDGGTEISSTTKARGKSLLWTLMMPVTKAMMKQRQMHDFNKLKAMIEA